MPATPDWKLFNICAQNADAGTTVPPSIAVTFACTCAAGPSLSSATRRTLTASAAIASGSSFDITNAVFSASFIFSTSAIKYCPGLLPLLFDLNLSNASSALIVSSLSE